MLAICLRRAFLRIFGEPPQAIKSGEADVA
jgi:hypothetical protein